MNSNENEKYEKLISLSKITEEAELYEDTKKYMEEVIKMKKEDLTSEERELFCTAYKDSVSFRRSGWRMISDIEERENRHKSNFLHLILDLKSQLETEITNLCNHMFEIIDNYLLNKANSDEAKTFYYKLKGDYYRYLAEIANKNDNSDVIDNAKINYDKANEFANKLPVNNIVRLGLSLNYSVFYYEIKGDKEMGRIIAQNAIDNVGVLKKNESGSELVQIIKTMQENINMWKAEPRNDDDDGHD